MINLSLASKLGPNCGRQASFPLTNFQYNVYTMTTMKINIRKARERFSEIINAAAVKGERVILLSKNKPKAAIVSLKDLELIEDRSVNKAKRLAQVESIRKMRERLAKKGVVSDSLLTLKKTRKERVEQLTGSN